MPESEVFLETYLREIGVKTPVSLVLSRQAISKQTVPGAQNSSEVVQLDMPQGDQAGASQIVQADADLPARLPENKAVPVEQTPIALKTLDELSQEASDCRLCALADTRKQVVFGVGHPQADLVFIGEAPGRDEDLRGEPFVGRAGQLLDRMLHAINLDRKNVYIMNTIKCRPPNNRDPKPDEVKSCHLWFEQQLNLLQPKMICLLGRVAAQTVLETDAPLGALRGCWHDYHGIPVWVTYHPAYLLRSPQQKKKSWQDFTTLSRRLRA